MCPLSPAYMYLSSLTLFLYQSKGCWREASGEPGPPTAEAEFLHLMVWVPEEGPYLFLQLCVYRMFESQ